MKNRNTALNSLFKNSLDATYQSKWDKVCKNYTLDLILNLFIGGVSSKERYQKSDFDVFDGIIWKLKDKKNINFISNKYYYSIRKLFLQFYKFYLENWSTLQDLFGDDIYQNKKNSLKENLDLKKIFEWQEFLEKDDSEQAEKYLNKLKYLYRVFSERELVEIFKGYINSAYKLHNLNTGYENLLKGNKPFDIVKKDLDDDLIKKLKGVSEDSIKIINSLFSRYLHVLKINKKLKENLSVEKQKSKDIQDKTKEKLYEDLDTQIENIVSVRIRDGGLEDVDYVDGNPVAPIGNYMVGDSKNDNINFDDIDDSI